MVPQIMYVGLKRLVSEAPNLSRILEMPVPKKPMAKKREIKHAEFPTRPRAESLSIQKKRKTKYGTEKAIPSLEPQASTEERY